MHLGRGLLLAGMGRGGEPERAVGGIGGDARQLAFIAREGRRGGLQIADAGRGNGAEAAKALGLGVVLREAQLETGEQRADQAWQPLPAAQRALRHAAVQQQQRRAGAVGLGDEVGPELGFDPEREIGPPMLEEAPHIGRAVDRDILMPGAIRRQAMRQQPCRGDGAGRHQHRQRRPLDQQPVDQRQHRHRFAVARGMHPDQRPGWSHAAGMALALGETLAILFAMRHAPREIERDHRAERGGAHLIKAKKTHGGRLMSAAPRVSNRAAPRGSSCPARRPHGPCGDRLLR